MEAREIRVGSKVNLNGADVTVKTIEYNPVSEEYFIRVLESIHQIKASYLSPIPITEELLLKAGFEYCVFTIPDEDGIYRQKKAINKEYYRHPKLSNEITYYLPYYDLNYHVANTEIKYLHQLQNLYFALTGSELTFKQ